MTSQAAGLPPLIQPKTLTITDIDGGDHEFVVSKLPATVAREVVAVYPFSAMPKIGDYAENEKIMLKMMKYVAKQLGDNQQRLVTRALIDNHCPDWEVLAKLEMAMIEYNTSFFANGRVSHKLERFGEIVQQSVIKILTQLLEQSSNQDGRRSTN